MTINVAMFAITTIATSGHAAAKSLRKDFSRTETFYHCARSEDELMNQGVTSSERRLELQS